MKKKILGIPIMALVIGLVVMGIGSAALLTYFGQVKTTLTINQGMKLDDKHWDVTVENDIVGDSVNPIRNITYHEIKSYVDNNINIKLESSCETVGGDCNVLNHLLVKYYHNAGIQDYVIPNCDINVTNSQTIQSGIDSSDEGNVVCVLAGTYNENVILNKGIHLIADGNVIIIGNVVVNADYSILEGFDIQHDGGSLRGIDVGNIGNSINTTIRNNKVSGAFNTGLTTNENAHSDLVIINNEFINLPMAGIGSTENFDGSILFNKFENVEEGIGVGLGQTFTTYGNIFKDNVADMRLWYNESTTLDAENNYYYNGNNIDINGNTNVIVNFGFEDLTSAFVLEGNGVIEFASIIEGPAGMNPDHSYTLTTTLKLN